MARRNVRAESRSRYYIRVEARKRGWNISHVGAGGDFLEENEIVARFPDIGLGRDKPDFMVCLRGEPAVVIEAKSESDKLQISIEEAIGYAETINATGRYRILLAVGAAGEADTGFMVEVRFLTDDGWVPLKSMGYALTTIPSIREVELALASDDGSTSVSVPASHEFIDAAIELSIILRSSKVEAPLRPKVIGAIVMALYQGTVDTEPDKALSSINELAAEAINSSTDISPEKKAGLIDALRLSGADFHRLAPSIRRVVAILRRLNVRSVLQTDTDFLGLFYESFLRYGYDNNALGIVFTPRHITRYCVDLIGASPADRVIDVACGTGGFLVSAFDRMLEGAKSPASVAKIKSSLFGFDTNPTVWALATVNMFARGDGKGHIEHGSCLDPANKAAVRGSCSKAFLNPPFSQEGEPERDFIDVAMDALEPEGMLAAIVYAGIFADDEHKAWRREFLRKHSLLAIISMPEDLFYPTAAPTSIIIAQAHVPLSEDAEVLMAKVWNDGFVKLKSRRIEREGNQLPEVKDAFDAMMSGEEISSELATTIRGGSIIDGTEWSPQQWLPQPHSTDAEMQAEQQNVIRSVYQSVAYLPELADEAIDPSYREDEEKAELPVDTEGSVSYFFNVLNGRSTGEKITPKAGFPTSPVEIRPIALFDSSQGRKMKPSMTAR